LVKVVAILFFAALASSPYLDHRLEAALSLSANSQRLEAISNRQRLAYWKASIDLIEQAPIVGHGTGSVAAMFKRYAAAHPDPDFSQATNPHNQTFAIALQLGLLGTVALYGMWFAHGGMFRQPGMAAWFGMVIVIQNVVGSLVNSHLSDFTQGWTYVVCVGVAGGMVLRQTPPGSAKLA
jgi:O-antigen ligase